VEENLQNQETILNQSQIPHITTKKWVKIGLLIFAGLILLMGSFYAGVQYAEKKGRHVLTSQPTPTIKPLEGSTGIFNSPTESPTRAPIPIVAKDDSELKSLDNLWNLYSNYKFGFSIKIPKETRALYGSCRSGDQVEEPMSPVKVFEEGNKIYIAREFDYEFTDYYKMGEKVFYQNCQKKKNDLSQHNGVLWELLVKEVKNEQELESFIKERFGSGCSLGEKRPQRGALRVSIEGYFDEKTKEINPECMLNHLYVLMYIPQRNIAVAWSGGQDALFTGRNPETMYDNEMIDSFAVVQ